LTLLLLALAAIVISLGPGTLAELWSGLTFVRPPVAELVVPQPRVDADLQARLVSVVGSPAHGRVSALVVDLQGGATASVDAERAFPAASLFKMPILIQVLAQEDAGRLDPERRLAIRPEDWTDGSGVLQARVGDQLTVRELTQLMIQDSDNIAALVLLDAVGIANVNALAQQLGLHSTHVVDHRAGEAGDHTTSAADMAHLLVNMAGGQLVNQHVSEEALRLLELKQSVNWLGNDLPFWVKVAHKWGDLPQARNDAGIVFSPRGTFVVAVLTEDGVADETATLIARAARTVYDYQGRRSP
jgi:beta-lactamase class A